MNGISRGIELCKSIRVANEWKKKDFFFIILNHAETEWCMSNRNDRLIDEFLIWIQNEAHRLNTQSDNSK